MQNQDTVTAVSYYSLVAVWNILTEYPSAYRLPPAIGLSTASCLVYDFQPVVCTYTIGTNIIVGYSCHMHLMQFTLSSQDALGNSANFPYFKKRKFDRQSPGFTIPFKQ